MKKLHVIIVLILLSLTAWARPEKYLDLLKYSTPAPDQGDTNSCLFVGSTGTAEIIYNKVNKAKINFAEQFLMWVTPGDGYSWLDSVVLGLNTTKQQVLNKDLPFYALNPDGSIHDVWSYPERLDSAPRVSFNIKLKSIQLFHFGNKWSTYQLDDSHVELVKEALLKYESPILINYNDEGYWHVINVIGYDDTVAGTCYDYTPSSECKKNFGSFIVRDHFGAPVEYRDTDWFRVKVNAAYVIMED